MTRDADVLIIGAGTHPCGSVTGVPGHNAAQAILCAHFRGC